MLVALFSVSLMTAVKFLYKQVGFSYDIIGFVHVSVHLAVSSYFSKCFGSSHMSWRDTESIASLVMNRCQETNGNRRKSETSILP